jgi:hypothetical protein
VSGEERREEMRCSNSYWRRAEEDAARAAAEEEDMKGSEHVGLAIDLVSRVISFEDGAMFYYKVVIL